jgi:beta-1,4-mannosyltransferase
VESWLRVVSVPAGHPYVQHLDDPDGARVTRLPDPVVPGRPAGRWWPHAALDAGWVRAHADTFDVLHVHFGFEHRTPDDLAAVVAATREAGVALVLTVHDLRNPHEVEQGPHLERLGVLVRGADEVLTLTPGAAAEVRARWGREAHVVPHPHVVPVEVLGTARTARGGDRPVVGLHLKSLRTNVDERAVRAAVAELGDLEVRVRVHLHRDLGLADHGPDAVRAALVADLERAHAEGAVELVRHGRWDDAELHRRLRGLDVLVLPYSRGTHSGMVELCADLGTPVVAPEVGFWHEQHEVHGYRLGPEGPEPGGLRAAVVAALGSPAVPARAHVRLAQRREVAAAHERLYRRALRWPA